MVKVTVITTSGKRSDIFEETKTPKEVLDYFDVDYAVATNQLDGVKLDVQAMNKSLRELGVGKECRLASIVKMDNAAQIVIAGASAVLTSSVKRSDWERIAKLSPESLAMEEEDSDEVVFRVGLDDGPGSANEYGVMFGSATNQEGKATVTILLDPEAEDKVELVRENVGQAILYLNELEKAVPEILENVDKMEKEINEHIVVM